jgi:hypothetical protein
VSGEREFFIIANSFAAPIVSDRTKAYVRAADPELALNAFRETYNHPRGLFAARVYHSADDYERGKPPLAQYLSDDAREAGWPRSIEQQ